MRWRSLWFSVFLSGILLAAARAAAGCSMCRCGDPTFNALGNNVYSDGQFHLALDWDRFNKSQGTTENGVPGIDHEIENRITLSFSYSIAERVVLVARLPYSFKGLTTTTLESVSTVDAHGLSDPEFYALFRLWSSNFGPGQGRRTWVSAVVGVKTPWGQNDVQQDGERVDEHAQPGTGSTDLFGGLSGTHLFDDVSALFASAQYRGTGRNSFGYKYGDITMASLAYERKVTSALDAVVEMDFRYAGRDQVNGAGQIDASTGGDVLYLTPRLVVSLGGGLVLRVAAQIPIWTALYGIQKEYTNYNAGLTFLF